ncbi:MAG: family 43 glycosylhydrolase [Clostridia bacterium]|nr:family 43 glycosylhydrolase [Clostridia bacterium]
MKNFHIKLITLLCLFSLLPSCGGAPITTEAPITDDTSAVTEEPITENTFFELDGSVKMENGMIRNIDGDKNKIIISRESLEASNTFDFKFSFDSKSAILRVYLDIKQDENGEITSAKMLRIDPLNGRFNLIEIKGDEQTQLGYAKYPFQTKTEYQVRIRNLSNSISVYFGTDEIETAPIIDVYCTRPAKAKLGICFNGSTKSEISEPTYQRSTAPAEDNRYKNPMLTSTVIADPTVLLYEGTYYMFTTGSFMCRTSTDLINWKEAGAVASSTTLYGTKYFGGAGIYERDGTFYLLYTSHQTESSGLSVFYATSDKILGPYVQKGTMQDHVLLSQNSPAGSFLFNDPVSGKDILYFYRTDPNIGNVLYATNVTVADGKITITDRTPTKLTEPSEAWERKSENGASTPVCERPNVIYRDGYYYVFYAGSHYKTSYSEGYIVSDNPLTGFVKPKDTNPLLDATASITGVGCTWIVESPDGSELFVLYHAHDEVDSYRKRRLCMDRLTFRENPEGGPDIPVIHGPTVTYQPAPFK